MSDLSNQSLWFISTSVFIGGIIGSPHCLSMCGPIVMNFASRRSHLVSYQLGRMMAYSIAGAILGAFGGSLLGDSRPNWVSGLTLCTIAFLLIFNGYRALRRQPLHFSPPQWINQFVGKLWSFIRVPSLPKILTAGFAGFLTVFLPCGHLYGFLLGAAVTGSAFKGAMFMFAFWLGSTPLLSASGGLLQKIFRSKLRKNGQRWAGALLIASGLWSLIVFGSRTEGFSKPTDHTTVQSETKNLDSTSPDTHHCH